MSQSILNFPVLLTVCFWGWRAPYRCFSTPTGTIQNLSGSSFWLRFSSISWYWWYLGEREITSENFLWGAQAPLCLLRQSKYRTGASESAHFQRQKTASERLYLIKSENNSPPLCIVTLGLAQPVMRSKTKLKLGRSLRLAIISEYTGSWSWTHLVRNVTAKLQVWLTLQSHKITEQRLWLVDRDDKASQQTIYVAAKSTSGQLPRPRHDATSGKPGRCWNQKHKQQVSVIPHQSRSQGYKLCVFPNSTLKPWKSCKKF